MATTIIASTPFITTNNQWYIWNQLGTQTATITSNSVWTQWATYPIIGTSSGITTTGSTFIRPAAATPQELQALAARRAENERRYEAHCSARDQADAKARLLLLDHLTPKQRQDFEATRAFFVQGPSGIRYRIRHGRAGNIDAINPEGRIIHRLCAHPVDDVPHFDTMLAQKLMLEHDDLGFTQMANRHHCSGSEQVLEPLH